MKNKKNPACQTKAELMQEIEALQQALEPPIPILKMYVTRI